MIGQDAVFDRPEQRGDNAEAGQGAEQNRHRLKRETKYRQSGYKNLKEFQPLRHPRLVEAVGEFAAERRQKEIGRDENGARQRDQGFRVGGAGAEQDQEYQRGFEKIVVECREKLAPEQWRKAPR